MAVVVSTINCQLRRNSAAAGFSTVLVAGELVYSSDYIGKVVQSTRQCLSGRTQNRATSFRLLSVTDFRGGRFGDIANLRSRISGVVNGQDSFGTPVTRRYAGLFVHHIDELTRAYE